jgi:MFS family permease
MADRHGPLWPAELGLFAGGVALLLLPAPQTALLLAVATVLAAPMLGMLWTPAMALLSDGAEARGIDPAFGFGLANMAWGAGAAIGGSGGGALAQATSDAVPFFIFALLSFATAGLLAAQRSAAGQAIR